MIEGQIATPLWGDLISVVLGSLLLVATSCGGDADSIGRGDARPDAAASGSPDAAGPGVDAGAGEVLPDAAPPDAGSPAPDGGPTGPTIESVETSDGFTQVRQGESVELVITGAGLDGVTRVAVGEIAATLSEQAAGEVKASLSVPHATAPGPRDITVSGPAGSYTAPSAIEVTPYVVAPSAPSGGHGTFQSPMSLCSAEVATSQRGDTILLLAGQHLCRFPIDLARGGQVIQGEGEGTTIVGGADGRFGGFRLVRPLPFPARTTFRDLTIDARSRDDGAIRLADGGALSVERVTILSSVISLGECPICRTTTEVTDSTFLDGGIVATGDAQIQIRDSIITGEGIRTNGGRLQVTGTTFDGCSTGVALQSGGDGRVGLRGEITSSTFTDCETGLMLERGDLVIADTTIRGIFPLASDRGVFVTGGDLEARGVTIAGHWRSGIEALLNSDDVLTASTLTLADLTIEGGQYGVRLHGEAIRGGLRMSSSSVRDQTVAAVSLAIAGIDTYDLRGGNQLSVVSGVALDDAIVAPMFITPIEAAGIALNGRPMSDAGLQRGPIDRSPDFRIVDPQRSIQF